MLQSVVLFFRFTVAEYSLENESVESIAFLLNDAEVQDPFKGDFMQYLKRKEAKCGLRNLHDLLEEYSNSDPMKRPMAEQIRAQLDGSEAGSVFNMAKDHPNFFKLAALLFPKKVCSFYLALIT